MTRAEWRRPVSRVPVDFGCKYLFPGLRGIAFYVPFDALILKRSLIPLPPGSRGIIALARKSLQNPEPKEVRDQNLGSKGVTAWLRSVSCAACAGAIMNEFEMRRKVRCHRRAVENYTSSKSQEGWSRGILLLVVSRGRARPVVFYFKIISGVSGRFIPCRAVRALLSRSL